MEIPGVLFQAASLIARSLEEGASPHENLLTWSTSAARELPGRPASSLPVSDGFWDLYSGNPGIALFFAAHGAITGEDRSRALALEALAPIRPLNGRLPVPAEGKSSIGALVGIGSWIYALIRAGRLLEEPQLVEEALELSSLITPAAILDDPYLDLAFGSAGALLVLLALDEERSGPNPQGHRPMELAALCARRLLEPPGDREASLDADPSLAHGTAGMILALSRYFARTADRRAADILERMLESRAESSLENEPRPEWCRGSAGTAIALAAGLRVPLTEKARWSRELEHTLSQTLSAPLCPHDHLCCGNMGVASVLAHLAAELGRPDLGAAAQAKAMLVLRVAKTRGRFACDYSDLFDCSLFRGGAGIGYALLELARPGFLPSVVAFE